LSPVLGLAVLTPLLVEESVRAGEASDRERSATSIVRHAQ